MNFGLYVDRIYTGEAASYNVSYNGLKQVFGISSLPRPHDVQFETTHHVVVVIHSCTWTWLYVWTSSCVRVRWIIDWGPID